MTSVKSWIAPSRSLFRSRANPRPRTAPATIEGRRGRPRRTPRPPSPTRPPRGGGNLRPCGSAPGVPSGTGRGAAGRPRRASAATRAGHCSARGPAPVPGQARSSSGPSPTTPTSGRDRRAIAVSRPRPFCPTPGRTAARTRETARPSFGGRAVPPRWCASGPPFVGSATGRRTQARRPPFRRWQRPQEPDRPRQDCTGGTSSWREPPSSAREPHRPPGEVALGMPRGRCCVMGLAHGNASAGPDSRHFREPNPTCESWGGSVRRPVAGSWPAALPVQQRGSVPHTARSPTARSRTVPTRHGHNNETGQQPRRAAGRTPGAAKKSRWRTRAPRTSPEYVPRARPGEEVIKAAPHEAARR
jgi:hypothetical protein